MNMVWQTQQPNDICETKIKNGSLLGFSHSQYSGEHQHGRLMCIHVQKKVS